MRTRSQALAERAQVSLPVDLLHGLNAEQIEVVTFGDGPCRVLALAGSGKTESLSRRIARLVQNGQDPRRILAVTFAKKNTEQMTERIAEKYQVSGVRIGTWHSFCLQVIREDRLEASTWAIEDSGPGTNTKTILKDVLGYKGMDWKGADVSAIAGFISRCKANLYAPDSPDAEALARRAFGWQATKAVQAFSNYNDALQTKGILSFDDYLVIVAEHFATNEEARLTWAARYDHVMQDEGQDANRAQKTIAWLLARDHRNYMIIGDCYQAIYGFRGSSPEFLACFHDEWPDAKTIVLGRNYRSGRAIIRAANAVVAKAVVKGIDVPTQMICERDTEGEVRIIAADNLDDEANTIAETILKATVTGETTLADHTILFRTNAQSRAIEESLLTRRIPYVVVGGTSFYERREVRDLLAYLRLAERRGQRDDIKRSINTPFRFLGNAFVAKVMDKVEGITGEIDWVSVVGAVADAEGRGIQQRQKDSAASWSAMIRDMQLAIDKGSVDDPTDEAKANARPSALLDTVVRVTQYITWLNKEEGDETTSDSAAANVRELVRVAERFATATELLDYIDETIRSARKQRADKSAGGARVLLMSVHRSKGLEWPHVYVAGMNEMVLPHAKGDPEEERRLAYVAMTRARDVLTMSYVRRIATRAGIKDVQPSRFLLDTKMALDVPKGTSFGVIGAPTETDPFEGESAGVE